MEKVEFFKKLGFNEYDSKTLDSLLKLKVASAKEISSSSKVPQNKLYSILNKFEKLGILASIPVEPKKFQLINIKTFISKKLKERQQEILEIKKNIGNIDEVSPEIFSLILGQRTIMDKLAENNLKVRHEILGVQRNWKYWAEGIRAMEKAVKKGVKVRLIGVINPETSSRAKEWKKIGCKIRAYNQDFGEFPLRFTVFDNKEARITLGKPEIKAPKEYITLWTTSKPLVAILRKQFEQMWRECEDF